MKENLIQDQHLTQTQTLAPHLAQFGKLLAMNTAAIEDEVQRRLDENPALERVEDESFALGDTTEEYSESATELQRGDYSNEDDMPAYLSYSTSSHTDGDERRRIMEGSTMATETMNSRLIKQLSEIEGLDDRTRAFAEYIIGNLDDNGRLTSTLAAMADEITFKTGQEVYREDLLPAFETVRTLDPAGVCAVDLRDCLLLQLKRRTQSPQVKLATEIVDRDFEMLAARRMDKLRSRTGAAPELLDKAMEVIQSLNPKPGGSDAGSEPLDRAMHISPDFIVEPDETDPTGKRFLITLTQRIPELTVAQWHTPGNNSSAKDNAFIQNRTRDAGEFIDMLKRRTETLMDVMRAIVDIQADFFRTEDPAQIKPMIIRDIEKVVNRDISVISRATADKYVATEGGIYPLKMFFNEKPIEDSDISVHRILNTLQNLIDAEDKKAPLSDDALTKALQAQGIDIARRTVAKYREQLNIPNSRGRRSMKT